MEYKNVVCLDEVWRRGSVNPVVCITSRIGDNRVRNLVLQEEFIYYPDKNGKFRDLFDRTYSKFSVSAQKLRMMEKRAFLETAAQEANETDIHLLKRFCSDNEVDFVVDPEIMFIDIETDTEGGFSSVDSPTQPVILIGCLWKDKYHEFLLGGNCSTEKDLLSKFAVFFRTVSPDVVSGWNIISFDLPYIMRRMISCGLDPNEISPLGKAKVVESKIKGRKVYLKGINVFDLYLGYKKLRRNEMYDNKLTTVGRHELGLGKLPVYSVGELWRKDVKSFVEYNKRDLEICYALDKKIRIIEYFSLLRNISKCYNMNELLSSNSIIDAFLLYKAKKESIVLPSANRMIMGSTFSGAHVIEPSSGVYDWVGVFDFKAMYPSIIESCNLSIETKVSEKSDSTVNINGLNFSHKEGFIPKHLRELMSLRDEFKEKMLAAQIGSDEHRIYDYLQHAVKALQNSFYGVLGFPKSRFYDRDIAETITWTGKYLLNYTKKVAEGLGYEVLYGDTDSIFISLKVSDQESAIRIGEELEDKINESFKTLSGDFNLRVNSFHIKFEKLYSKMVFVEKSKGVGAKKKYAGLCGWKEGFLQKKPILQIVGFEFKRSDSPTITHEIQQKLLEMILNGESQKEVCRYLDEIKRTMQERSVEDLGIPKPITKPFSSYRSNAIHKRAAEWSNKYLGMNWVPGSKGVLLFIKRCPPDYPFTDVVLYEGDKELPPGFVIDTKKIFDKYVDGKILPLFASVGWLRDAGQTRLEEFCKC